jgi:hypothetical protein
LSRRDFFPLRLRNGEFFIYGDGRRPRWGSYHQDYNRQVEVVHLIGTGANANFAGAQLAASRRNCLGGIAECPVSVPAFLPIPGKKTQSVGDTPIKIGKRR